ncbi:MAG: hypothetical protein UV38_C0001G0183 [candidate division TM6 bacterium GW2011_GWE2_42_60]|nr:MAG: hypothetical protein UV38_C0001G0183 [candidate division TM6 bacterium GW2011_GWE2_42_60]HBY05622.1 hypothetical protein [Candidatus Dependentiae bacterium]
MKKYIKLLSVVSSFSFLLAASDQSSLTAVVHYQSESSGNEALVVDENPVTQDIFLPIDQKINMINGRFDTITEKWLNSDSSFEQDKKIMNLFSALQDKNPYGFYRMVVALIQSKPLSAEEVILTLEGLLHLPKPIFEKINNFSVELPLYNEYKPTFKIWRDVALPKMFEAFIAYINEKTPGEMCFEEKQNEEKQESLNEDKTVAKRAIERQKLANLQSRERAIKLMQSYKAQLDCLSDDTLSLYFDVNVGLRFFVDKKNQKTVLSLCVEAFEKNNPLFKPLNSKVIEKMDALCAFFLQELKELKNRTSSQTLFSIRDDERVICGKWILPFEQNFFVDKTAVAKNSIKALDALQIGLTILDKVAIENNPQPQTNKSIRQIHQRTEKLIKQLTLLKNELPTVFLQYMRGVHPFIFTPAMAFAPYKEKLHPQFFVKIDNEIADPIKAFFESASEEVAVLLSQKELEPQKKIVITKDLAYKYRKLNGGIKRKWINPREL